MKLRTLTAAMAIVLGVVGLSACTTKIGLAAIVNGKHVTENSVASYLTPKAQAIQTQDASGATVSIPSRSFVLQTIINSRLEDYVLAKLPGGGVSKTALDAQVTKALQGKTTTEIATSQGIVGYTKSFNDLWVRSAVLNQILVSLNQATNEVAKALQGLKFPVTVSGRYGSWDAKKFTLNSGLTDGYPAYMQFPTASASAGK